MIPGVIGPIFDRNQGLRALVILDSLSMNWLIPIIVLGLCWIFSKGINRTEAQAIFLQDGKVESEALFPYWLIAVKWGIPCLVLLGLVLQIIGLFV